MFSHNSLEVLDKLFDRYIMSSVVSDLFYTDNLLDREILGDSYVTFAKKPTAESKFIFVYELLKSSGKLPTLRQPLSLKSNKKASKIRTRANKKFQNKNYVGALVDYNMSVMTANIGSQEYALALANRSAALFYLEEYDSCISDIHRAIVSQYPDDLAYKLYHREVKCLVKMGKISKAKSKFREFLSHKALTKLPKEKKNDVEMELKMLLSESTIDNKNNEDKQTVIKLLGGPNKHIPALSKFVKMNYSESMGRCLVVSTNIHPGDVLAIEKPYAGILRKESYEHNCRNCFKRCLCGIPCQQCTLVIYCNETCRAKSYENGHKYECQMLTTFFNCPSMEHMEHLSLYLFLTTFCKLGLEKYVSTVCALRSDNTDPMMRGFANGKYLSDEFTSVYTLEGNESKRKISDLFIRHCYAASIIASMIITGLKIPSHQLGIIGESLVHIICVVSSNAHAITQPPERKNWSLPNTKRFMPVASFLLPVLSLLNHHCDPNVVRHNYNGTVVLRAIQPIPKDSQLFDNYGNLYAANVKEDRQKALFNQYCFNCQCEPCKENWPLYSTLLDQSQPESSLLNNISPVLYKDQSDKLQNLITQIKEKKTDGYHYIQFLYSYLEFLHNNVKKPWVEYCECQETIKEILYTTTDKFVIKDS